MPQLTPYYSFKDRLFDYHEANKNTKDIPELALWDRHFVFVYGTLKSGLPRHGVLERQGVQYQGIFRTVENNFDMCHTMYHFPVALRYQGIENPGAIKGELYLVPLDVIIIMDKLEANGTMFERESVDVIGQRTPNGPPETLSAFMYVGLNSFWKWRAYAFMDTPVRKDKMGFYRYYSRNDHNDLYKKIVETTHETKGVA